MKYVFLFILMVLLFTLPLSAEMSFRDLYTEYLFVETLSGNHEKTSLMFHSYSTDAGRTELQSWSDRQYSYNLWGNKHGAFKYMVPETFFSYNSYRPFGFQDGSLWQGKGFNNVTSMGIEWMSDYYSIRIYPEIWWAQNGDISIIPTNNSSGWGDYWNGTKYDRLQRPGDSYVFHFDWGQSDIRFYWKDYLTLGVSTESITLGSGRKNNILLSNNAGGFPHIDLGTYRPQDIWKLGKFEAHIFWGTLKESEYYDENPDNDYAWYSGVTFAYAPSFLKGFTIGVTHQYYKPLQYWDPLDLIAFLPFFSSNKPGEADDEDGMVAFDINWDFPEVGFTFYGELANNDWTNPVLAPEHTLAYTLGISQIIHQWSRDKRLVLSFEHSDLGQRRTMQVRAAGPWYRHGWAGWEQGFANKGQLPGASIGPGSNSQWFDISYYYPKGLVGFDFTRICYDSDYFYNVVVKEPDYVDKNYGQYIDFVFGLDALYYLYQFNLYGKLDIIYKTNDNWVQGSNKYNVHAELGFSYNF